MAGSSDPMGLGLAGGAMGAVSALRQIILEREMARRQALVEQQQQFENSLKLRQEGRLGAEHAFNLQTLGDQRAAAAAENRDKMLTAETNRRSIGDIVSPTDPPLPDYLKGPQPLSMPATPEGIAAPGEPVTGRLVLGGTVANSPAPGLRQTVYTGTDKQRTDATQKAGVLRLINSLPAGSRERMALEYESLTGKNAPTGVFDPKTPVGEIRDTATGMVRVGGDNTVTPITVGGKQVQGYHPAPQPIVVQTGAGPQIVNRGTATAAPIKDAAGNVVGPQEPASLQVEAAHKKDALGVLDQLDQSIDAAKDLVGPGEGRFSSLEQMAGAADPRIQALGTKMLIAKMKVDAAIGGMRAAASPQILARWDNLLANKVTPEGLKASVQALREILGGPGAGGSHPDLQKFGATYKWDGSKYVRQGG